MSNHRQRRWFYPIDESERSRCKQAQPSKARCGNCRRPHGKTVAHLSDGRWWDVEVMTWRSGTGKALPDLPPLMKCQETILYTKVALVHSDHDLSSNEATNLRTFCRRCNMLHNKPEHWSAPPD